MNKLNYEKFQLKVTNHQGCEIFPYDIDNIKYRVIRVAHSLKDFERIYSIKHWSSSKPINVRLIDFDKTPLLLITPDMPPAIRFEILKTLPKSKKPRDFFINNSSYARALENYRNESKKEGADMAALQDFLDEAKYCLNETKEEKNQLFITYINTLYSLFSVDYNYALMLYELFGAYLSKETVDYFIAQLQIVKKMFEDDKFKDPVFRSAIPKLSKDFTERVSVELKEEHFEAVKRKYPDHPALKNAEEQSSILDKMHVILYKIYREEAKKASTAKQNAPKETHKVVFSLAALELKADRVKAILNHVMPRMDDQTRKNLDGYPFMEPECKIKTSNMADVDRFATDIESNVKINRLFVKLYNQLKIKLPNTPEVIAKRNSIKNAFKKKNFLKGFHLILDLQDYHKQICEENASPTIIPPIHV